MLLCSHYGSADEAYKIAYGKPTLASRARVRRLRQMRKLRSPEVAAYRLRRLRALPRQEGFGFDQEDGEEAEESKSGSCEELVCKVESYKVCKVVRAY